MSTKPVGLQAYTYDANGNKLSESGSWARLNIPAPVTAASYDNANELTTLNGVRNTYDKNGNLLTDGTHTYTWNVRNQLTATTGAGAMPCR